MLKGCKMAFLDLNDFNVEEGLEVVNAPSVKDKVVIDLIKIYEEIEELVLGGHRDPNDKIFKEYYKKIEKVLKDRFGPEFEIVYNSGAEYAYEIVGPLTETGILDIKGLFTDRGNILLTLFNSLGLLGTMDQMKKVCKFEDYLEQNPIVVDLANSRIENWPKGNKIRILWDIVTNLIKYKHKEGVMIAPRLAEASTIPELVAPVIHEIGHAFTAISSLYQTRKNKIALEDTIRDQIKKGKGEKEAFMIGFKETFAKDDPIYKNKKELTYRDVLICFNRSESKKYRFSQNVSTGTDAESQADQFAVRLGVGVELARFLDKFHGIRNYYMLDALFIYNAFLWLIIIAFAPGSLFIILYSAIISNLIMVLLGSILYLIDGGSGSFLGRAEGLHSYDPDLRRIQKIRLDLIRQIRTCNLPEDTKKTLVKKADLVQELCSRYTNILGRSRLRITTGSTLPVLGWLGSDDGMTSVLDAYDKQIEEGMENDLHLALNRF